MAFSIALRFSSLRSIWPAQNQNNNKKTTTKEQPKEWQGDEIPRAAPPERKPLVFMGKKKPLRKKRAKNHTFLILQFTLGKV
jgi:hypothetical protein